MPFEFCQNLITCGTRAVHLILKIPPTADIYVARVSDGAAHNADAHVLVKECPCKVDGFRA
jgi:hypothetical protein